MMRHSSRQRRTVDTGDTAWMLVATALVLLMTIGLGLFYAGLVRAKNTLNTFMMCVAALARRDDHLGARRLLAGLRRRREDPRRPRPRVPDGVGFEPRDGTTIPHLVFFAFQATFCIITTALVSGAVVERMRFGPFLVFAALWSVLVYAVLAHWAFGGGWLMAAGHARLRRRRARRDGLGLLGAGGGARRRRAQGLRPPGAAAAQRGLLPARRRAAVVRLVRLQRRQRLLDRQRQRARVHEHAADPGLHAVRLVRPRPRPRPPGHGDRRGDGDHRRLRRRSRPRAASSARSGRWCSARSPRCRATPSSSGARARASTRRSTCSPRTASPASSGSSSSASSRRRPGTTSPTACSTATPASSARSSSRRSPRRPTRSG